MNKNRHLSPSPSNNRNTNKNLKKKSTSIDKRSLSRSPSITKRLSPKKVVYMKNKPTESASSSDDETTKIIDETLMRKNRKKSNNNNNSDIDGSVDGEVHVQKMKQSYIDDSDDESNVEERLRILQQYLKKVKVGESKRKS